MEWREKLFQNSLVTAALVIALGVALLVTGCERSRPASPTTLRVQLSSEAVSLDPSLAEDGLSLKIISNIMDGLVGYDGAGKLVPRLAESYDVLEGGRRFVFTLRKGAAWSDGVAVKADDFVTAFRRALSPGVASKLAEMLRPIRWAGDFRAGESRRLGVSATPDGKFVIELEKPAPYFLQALTLPVAMPLRQDVLDAHQGRWPELAPTTGPYRLAEHKIDQKYVLRANEKSVRSPAIAEVELLIIQDESTASSLFEKGRLDVLTRVPALDFARFQRTGVVRVEPFYATYYVAFDTRRAPFNQTAWRQAVAASLRRREITNALDTGEYPATSWIPPGLEGHVPFDPEFSAAGWEKAVAKVKAEAAKRTVPVKAAFDSGTRNSLVMEKVQQDLERALGLKVQLMNLDWKTYVKTIRTDPPEIFRFGWLAPFADPISHLQALTSGNANNLTGWSNDEYNRLVAEVAAMEPGPKRLAKVLAAQRILVEQQAVVVPIYHYIQAHGVSKRVKGFRANPFGVVQFQELSW
ncbi:MAG: peptide ABC transporter substrate-binding protein [Bacteriovoracia bacterium]